MGTQLVILDPEAAHVLERGGLGDYMSLAACDSGRLVHQTRTTRTRLIRPDLSERQDSYYLKVYRYDRGERRLAWRKDKAAIEARNYRFLRETIGLDVPSVVAVGSRRRMGRLLDAVIVTRAVHGAEQLDEFFSSRWQDPRRAADDPLRRRILMAAADLVGRMHDGGFFHIDLQWRNLLIAPDGNRDFRLYVIDSPRGGIRKCAVMKYHGRLRDLSSLWKEAALRLSRTEQMRWFRRYWRIRRLGASQREMVRVLALDRSSKERS